MNRDDTGVRMEIVELPATAHPFFFGTQYHPEVRLSLRPFHFRFNYQIQWNVLLPIDE